MKKSFACMTLFLSIVLSGCGESGITVTGDNATITTNAENNNAQVIADTDVTTNVDVESDKSINNTTNNVSESSIKDSNEYKLQNENKQLQSEFDQLKEQNAELENKVNELESKDDTIPSIEYKDLGLSINGEDIPINRSGSMVTIDGREYVSKEIAEKLITNNESLSINDDTIYIGKIISEEANLFDKHVNDNSNCSFYDNLTDSYGNLRTNVLYFNSQSSHNIIFTLNRSYSFLKFTISIYDKAESDKTGSIIVKADNKVVYTSEGLNKQTEPFETKNISIDNCSLLTIEYNSDYYNECLISDAIVFN